MLKRISLLCMAILISIQLIACGSGSVATNEKVWIEDDYATSDSLGKDYDYESPSMGAPTTDSVISTEMTLKNVRSSKTQASASRPKSSMDSSLHCILVFPSIPDMYSRRILAEAVRTTPIHRDTRISRSVFPKIATKALFQT